MTCTSLLYLCPYPAPVRPFEPIHVHPDAHRFTHEVSLRNRPDKAAVAAIIAVIAHHEVVPIRHLVDTIPNRITCVIDQNLMPPFAQLLDEARIHGSRGRMLFEIDLLTVDYQAVAFVADLIARRPTTRLM